MVALKRNGVGRLAMIASTDEEYVADAYAVVRADTKSDAESLPEVTCNVCLRNRFVA